jgi:hypothetical protein
VTESDWLNATDPQAMLTSLGGSGKAGGRKLELFAAACLRRIAPRFAQQRSWGAIYSLELAEMTGVRQLDRKAWALREQGPVREALSAAALVSVEGVTAAAAVADWAAVAAGEAEAGGWAAGAAVLAKERGEQAALLRCLFGNPFRPPPQLGPGWLVWNDRIVQRLAEGIYDERDFTALPVLADALADAGCMDQEVLAHCRGRGPHARGCWVVDLLLGKG